MISSLRRTFQVYAGLAAMVPKELLAYRLWAWMQFIVQVLSMTILVYFWRAVYASTPTLGGLTLDQTIRYVLLAQILAPIVETRVVFQFGFLVQSGQIALELVRPVDFQARHFVENLAHLAVFAIQELPLLLFAWLVFGLALPADPRVWIAFAIALVLGQGALFFFDWIFACMAFYSTETWGLSVVRIGVATFFSGALVPLTMMPAWLQDIAAALPFAQAIFVPVSLLSGIVPLDQAPRVWLVQLAWFIGLAALSRLVFNLAVKQVTVQGG